MSKEKRKEALTEAFKAVHYRPPTAKEAKRISDTVDNHGTPGRPSRAGDTKKATG